MSKKINFKGLIPFKKQNYNRDCTLLARTPEEMKLKQVYTSIALVFFVVTLVIWKLNDIYKNEKNAQRQNTLQAQSVALRSTLASQISQLRNILSGYSLQIEESKINWIQLKPFYVLGVVQEDARNQLTVSKMYVQSGSAADRWNAQYIQQKLNIKSTNQSLTRVQLFVDQSNIKQLALIFFDQDKKSNPARVGVFVIGDISFLQRFFDLQRTGTTTQALLNTDNVVAAHSEYEYVSSVSKELNIPENKNFVDKQELRGTNLYLVNYINKSSSAYLSMPISILGIILGLGFMISGILVYVSRQQQADFEVANIVTEKKGASSSALLPNKESAQVMPPPVPDLIKSKNKLTSAADFEKSEQEFQRQLKQMTSNNAAVIKAEEIAQQSLQEQTAQDFVAQTQTQHIVSSERVQVEESIQTEPQAIAFVKPLHHDEQILPVQVQACVQQAIFNVDKQLRKSGAKITKDFQSFDSVLIDYNLFIKIFENIFINISINLADSDVKNLSMKSLDDELFVRLNIEASTKRNIYISDDIKNELQKIKCEFEQSFYDNRLVLRFQFMKPMQKVSVLEPVVRDLDSTAIVSPEQTPVLDSEEKTSAGIVAEMISMPEDLDIDSILSIDDEEKTIVETVVNSSAQAPLDLEKEMRTLKIKLEESSDVVEKPDIKIVKNEPTSDKLQIKIRKPNKT